MSKNNKPKTEDVIDYDISNISSEEYELRIDLKTSNNAFNKILKDAVSRLQTKMAGVKDTDFKTLNNNTRYIVLPDTYKNALALALKSTVKEIKRQVLSEKVVLLNGKIVDAYYIREEEQWNMHIVIRGGYKDAKYS